MTVEPRVTEGQRAFLQSARDPEPEPRSAALGAAVLFGLLAVLLGSVVAALESDRPVLAVVVYFVWWSVVATAVALIRWKRTT